MLIPYFLHFMNEAFVADVDDADKSKNTLDIELPGKDQRRKFELKDGEAFEITEDNPEGIEIEDLKLRKFVLQAIRGIKNIKEQERALELERISGGDSNVIKTIEKLYDTNDEEHIIRVNTKSSENDGTPDMYSLWEEIKDLKPYEYKYISLKGLSEKQKECFTLASEHFVGKGEYFLPIIFTDVYKKKSHGYEDDDVTFTKGDNLILKPDGTFDEINLRSAGCPLKFESYREVPDKYSKKEDVEKAFKDAVVGSITKYIYTYSKGKNVYLVIFDNKFRNSYKENMGKDLDGFFIFCAGRTVGRLGKDISIKKEEGYKNIFDALFDKIEISDEFYFLSSKTYDAYISYSGGENGKIVIYLDRKYCEEYNYENDSDKEKKRLDAKELLKRLNGNKKDIETDTKALMEVFSNIIGAEKAFWIMKQNKKHSEDYFLYPISLYSPNENKSNNESRDDNNRTVKQKGNVWNTNYNPQIIKEKYLTAKVLYSQKGMVKFPLFSFSNINNTYGERKDLNSKRTGFFSISGLNYIDPQKDYNPNRFVEDELGGNSVVASMTFLYNEQDKRCERDFRICFQESGRLLLLLKEEINNYVLKYLIQGKVFDLWVEKFWSLQKFNKIYADSAHVFNYLHEEMEEFETVDESTIKKLSKTWFVLSNEIISFFYSNIEKNVADPESGKHCLKLLDSSRVIDKNNKIGDVFNDKFIYILSALLESRWKSEEGLPPNKILINGMPLDGFRLTKEMADTAIHINKHLIRTFIAQCINNSLAVEASKHGHRGAYEIKNVNITISKSSIIIEDDSQTGRPIDKDIQIAKFNREKDYINQVKCEKYSYTTLTSLQGVFNYMCDKKENVSCDYGFKNDNFYVIFNFN